VSSNYYRYKIDGPPKTAYINIPIQITFDNLGREDGIKEFEEEVIEEPFEEPIEEEVKDEVVDLEEETRSLLEEDVEEDIEA
jgi:hypothetical protein